MHATVPTRPAKVTVSRRAASASALQAVPSLFQAPAPRRRAWLPWALSALAHVAVFCTIPFHHTQPPVFAIDAGKNSLELDLVAAPREVMTETAQPDVPVVVPPDPQPDPDPIVAKVEPQKVQPPEVKPEPPQPPQPEKGDGSSPQPGKAATTVHSEAGAIRDVKPDYLRNPPPTYPDAARRDRQEGLVRLTVIVDVEGRAESVTLSGTSGHELLDNAALNAVRNWRFRPAMEGGMPVRSRVNVPVRFRLDS